MWAGSSCLRTGEDLGTDSAFSPKACAYADVYSRMGAEISKKIKLTGGWGFRASETLLLSQNWNRYTQKHIGLTGQLLDSTSPLPLHKCRGFPQRALTASTATRAGGQGAVPTQLWQSGKPCCSPAVQAFVIPFANNPCFTAGKKQGLTWCRHYCSLRAEDFWFLCFSSLDRKGMESAN